MEDAGISRCMVSVIDSALHGIRQVFDLMSTEGTPAHELIDARLAAVPGTVQGYRVTLAAEAARGRVSASAQYAKVVEQVRGWTGETGEGGDFFAGLVERCAPTGELADRMREHARAATRAFADFGLFLADELEPQGRDKEAVGREHYALTSRYFLGATVDLEETYAWGWQELKRLADDMAATADRILPGAGVAEAVAAPRRRPGPHGPRARGVPRLDAGPRRPDARGHGRRPLRHPRAGPAHRVHVAPTNDGGIYYTGPSEDFVRPGRMWWSVPDGIDDFTPGARSPPSSTRASPATTCRSRQTAYRSDRLNRWQRLMCWVSRPRRGLGAVRRAADGRAGLPRRTRPTGSGCSTRSASGRRGSSSTSACTWSWRSRRTSRRLPPGRDAGPPSWAVEFLGQHCQMDEDVLDRDRRATSAGRARRSSYKVGERVWLQAARTPAPGRATRFDLKAFHRAALDLGSLGLDPLQAALARPVPSSPYAPSPRCPSSSSPPPRPPGGPPCVPPGSTRW